jgi:hypothetical protein
LFFLGSNVFLLDTFSQNRKKHYPHRNKTKTKQSLQNVWMADVDKHFANGRLHALGRKKYGFKKRPRVCFS